MIKVPLFIRRVATILALMGSLASPAASQDFVPGFEDLPLMRGLTPIPGLGHAFDSPSGRLIESHARGPLTRSLVETFYGQSLIPLGWTLAGKGRYRREKEILRVETLGQDGDLIVIFRLTPDSR
tara:strand:+ start:97 stop:471 length:375 start_codon:yes stop_codon:yes gene_type:complete